MFGQVAGDSHVFGLFLILFFNADAHPAFGALIICSLGYFTVAQAVKNKYRQQPRSF